MIFDCSVVVVVVVVDCGGDGDGVVVRTEVCGVTKVNKKFRRTER